MSLGELLEWAENEKAIPEPNSGCLIWLGNVDHEGYGTLWYERKMVSLHRLSLERKLGHPLGELHALHSCDVPCCFFAGHLRPGTHQDNMQDLAKRQRRTPPRGEKQAHAKLTEAQVLSIRADPRRNVRIGRELGVSGSLIGMIKARKIWTHI